MMIELSSLGHRPGKGTDSAVIADRFLIPGHWAHATRLSHPFLPEHTRLVQAGSMVANQWGGTYPATRETWILEDAISCVPYVPSTNVRV